MDTDIVVARYRESLSWLCTWPAPRVRRVFVYDKSGSEPPTDGMCPGVQVVPGLENVGREAETYLRHIVTNYDDLADRIVFTQADISEHRVNLKQLIDGRKPARVGLDMKLTDTIAARFSRTDSYCYKGLHVQPSGLTLGQFCDLYFPRTPSPFQMAWMPWPVNGIFMTTRDAIHKNPREVYERLWNDSNLRKEQTPDEAFLMERLWFFLFS